MATRKRSPVQPAPPDGPVFERGSPKVVRHPVEPKKRGKKCRTKLKEEAYSWPYLRYSAGRDYATNLNGISVEQLQQWPQYQAIPLATMRNWATSDAWTERRREFLEEHRQRFQSALCRRLVAARLKQLEEASSMLDVAAKKILEEDVTKALHANSLEGLLGAYVRLWQAVDGIQEKIVTDVVPETYAQAEKGAAPVAIQANLTPQEARAAALTVVRMRREELRAAARKATTQEEDEEESEEGPAGQEPKEAPAAVLRMINGKTSDLN